MTSDEQACLGLLFEGLLRPGTSKECPARSFGLERNPLQAPTAESLPGFLAVLAVGSGATCGRSVGYGAAPEPELAGRLRPIFVQHDRSRIWGVELVGWLFSWGP